MIKILKIKEKEKFLKKVYEILDNWGIGYDLWKNRTRGFFMRNLEKPHKAKCFVKLNKFEKRHNVKTKDFKEFKDRVRGEERKCQI